LKAIGDGTTKLDHITIKTEDGKFQIVEEIIHLDIGIKRLVDTNGSKDTDKIKTLQTNKKVMFVVLKKAKQYFNTFLKHQPTTMI
jgi:hypothetical protein